MKPYHLGLVLGRFQGLHIGHEAVIRKALSLCDRVIVLIGSADKSGTSHDPFPASLRREMLEAAFPRLSKNGRLILQPLNDLGVGNVPAWGDYVLSSAREAAGEVDCVVYGDEDKCRTWFPNHPDLRYVSLNRSLIDVNATKLRKIILNGDEAAYRKYTAKGLHAYFPQLRGILREIAEKEKMSPAPAQQSYACDDKV